MDEHEKARQGGPPFRGVLTFPAWVIFIGLIIPMVIGSAVPAGVLVFGIALMIWVLLLGLALNRRVPAAVRRSEMWFAVKITYVILYALATELREAEYDLLLIVLHLVAVYSVFSALFFVARSLVVAEEGRTSGFDRYLGTLFLMWFFPVGLWFLQPRIRRVLKGET